MLASAGFLGLLAMMMTTGMALDRAPAQYDVAVIQAVQDHSPATDLSRVVNRLGDYWWAAFTVAAAALVAGGRFLGRPVPGWSCRSEAIAGFVFALGLLPINALTKVLVESPRPDAAFGVFVDYTRHSYGFPSGHVYNDVLFYGVMAVYAPMWVGPKLVPFVRGAAISIIFLAGWARMVVGAHWPSDVLGGYLWGLAALALVVALATLVGRRFHPHPIELP